jgi:hypothetical protein
MTDHTGPADPRASRPSVHDETARRPWARPTLQELPHLSSLTLQSGDPIGGGGDTGNGGSTVF